MSAVRTRRNQPAGYHAGVNGHPSTRLYQCKNHDYVYYGANWTDEESNLYYRRGYYDEEGNYYRNLLIQSDVDTQFCCDFCDTVMKYNWKSGPVPSCPNCGAPMQETCTDELMTQDKIVYDDSNTYSTDSDEEFPLYKRVLAVIVMLSVFVVAVNVFFGIAGNDEQERYSTFYEEESPINYRYVEEIENIYVEEIGRSCVWLDETDSYYDAVTDCYFWYNDLIDYPDWQYWYEEISSDFGDYGWMEYDREEMRWYIETSNGNWIVLPDNYKKDYLWYIQ